MSAILDLLHAYCLVGCLEREPKQQRDPIQQKRPMKKIIVGEGAVGGFLEVGLEVGRFQFGYWASGPAHGLPSPRFSFCLRHPSRDAVPSVEIN